MATQWTSIVRNTPVCVPVEVDGQCSFTEGEILTRQQPAVALGIPLASPTFSSIQPDSQPDWTVGSIHCSVVYIYAQQIDLGPIRERLSVLEEKTQELMLGQLAYALMQVIRNYVYNGAPPKEYGGSQPSVSSMASRQASMSRDEANRWVAVHQYINSKLPSNDYQAMDKKLRKLRLGDFHSVAEQQTASSQYLISLTQNIHNKEFRNDVIAAISILSQCSSRDRPLAPDRTLQPV